MQKIFFHKVNVPRRLLGKGPLWYDSCNRPLSLCIWMVACGRFDCNSLCLISFKKQLLVSHEFIRNLSNFSFSASNLKFKFAPENFTCPVDNHKIS